MSKRSILVAISLVGLCVLVRVFQFIPNVAPVGAVAIFSGFYFRNRFAYLVPAVAMFLGDLMIGFYNLWVMAAVYGSFLVAVAIGRYVRKSASPFGVITGTLTGSVIFYVVTNFAVWAISIWYPPTLGGLMLSYTMALPFFRNTLLSDLLFSGALFGIYAGARFFELNKIIKKQQIQAPKVSREVLI
jgi:hypothetical protein